MSLFLFSTYLFNFRLDCFPSGFATTSIGAEFTINNWTIDGLTTKQHSRCIIVNTPYVCVRSIVNSNDHRRIGIDTNISYDHLTDRISYTKFIAREYPTKIISYTATENDIAGFKQFYDDVELYFNVIFNRQSIYNKPRSHSIFKID